MAPYRNWLRSVQPLPIVKKRTTTRRANDAQRKLDKMIFMHKYERMMRLAAVEEMKNVKEELEKRKELAREQLDHAYSFVRNKDKRDKPMLEVKPAQLFVSKGPFPTTKLTITNNGDFTTHFRYEFASSTFKDVAILPHSTGTVSISKQALKMAREDGYIRLLFTTREQQSEIILPLIEMDRLITVTPEGDDYIINMDNGQHFPGLTFEPARDVFITRYSGKPPYSLVDNKTVQVHSGRTKLLLKIKSTEQPEFLHKVEKTDN